MRVLSTFVAIAIFSVLAMAEVPPSVLAKRLRERATNLEEFAELKRLADLRSVKIYLFGGSAASLAHYFRWQLEMERGDKRIGPERFDDTFASVYRPGQDVDVVVDGTEADIEFIGNAIRQRYPYFAGLRDKWELRSLHQTIGDKEAILGNRDFSDQNTDVQSIGLVALNADAREPNVRDALHWDDRLPPFLRAVAAAKAQFLASPKHGRTSRAQKGLNPPILSVIRFYIKASQFGLKVRAEDRRILKRIVAAWDPKAPENEYVTRWILRNAPKLSEFSIDLATCWNELDEVGLRDKLIARGGELEALFSMEPLRRSTDPRRLPPVGAPGQTARQLKVKRVTHGSANLRGYENLRRSPYGEAIAFASIYDSHGGKFDGSHNGLFTQVGDKPGDGRDNGWNLHYVVDPTARENVDFVRDGDNVWIFRTSDKIRVEPTQQTFDLDRALEVLVNPPVPRDRGALEQAARRLDYMAASDPDVRALLEKQIDILIEGPRAPGSLAYFLGLRSLIGTEPWKRLMLRLIDDKQPNRITDYLEVMKAVGQKGYAPDPALIEHGFKLVLPQQMADVLMALPLEKYPHVAPWIARLSSSAPVTKVLAHVGLRSHPEYGDVLRSMAVSSFTVMAFAEVFASKEVDAREDWLGLLDRYFESENYNDFLVAINASVAAIQRGRPEWSELIEMMLRKQSPFTERALLEHVLTLPRAREHQEWVRWVNLAMKRGQRAAWTFLQNHREEESASQWEETLFQHTTAIVALDGLAETPPEGDRSDSWHHWLGLVAARAENHQAQLIGKVAHFIRDDVDERLWLPGLQAFAQRNAWTHKQLKASLPPALREKVAPGDFDPSCAGAVLDRVVTPTPPKPVSGVAWRQAQRASLAPPPEN